MNTDIHLLIIEDNSADFRLIVRHLEKHGLAARCHCVADLEGLEAALEQGGWDAVLSDYSVPKLDFQHALGLLQARYPDLPLILVSGSVGEERAVELLKQGVWDFVLKDSLARLVPAIERSLREAGEQRERRRAEAALRESELILSGALQMAHAGHWEYDVDRDMFTFNDNFYRIFRTTAAAMGGYQMSSVDYARRFCHPDDAVRFQHSCYRINNSLARFRIDDIEYFQQRFPFCFR